MIRIIADEPKNSVLKHHIVIWGKWDRQDNFWQVCCLQAGAAILLCEFQPVNGLLYGQYIQKYQQGL